MNVCFFGLGSIGRRHLKNLRSICEKRQIPLRADAVRSSNAQPLPEDIRVLLDRQIFSHEEACSAYDAIFITNSTSMHYDTLLRNMDASDHFFVEKPLFEAYRSYIAPANKIIYVACPLRYCGVLERLRGILPAERVYAVQATCASYLPLWRPGTDYRTTYSAARSQGGGVCIDLIHEMDYLADLFGAPDSVRSSYGKMSRLEIDSEDVAMYVLRYPDKLVSIYLDYFSRHAQRDIVLRCENGTIYGDFLNNTIITTRPDGTAEKISWEESPNDKYLREMEHFLDIILGKSENCNDASRALTTLLLATEGK